MLTSIRDEYVRGVHLKNYSILLVEDDKGTQEELAEILTYFCKKVYIASDGLEALTLYYAHAPDLIISDIHMPKLSGLEFIKKIRQKDTKTAIAIVSAYTDVDLLLLATELHLLKYLVKPITKSKLLEVFKLFKNSKEYCEIKLDTQYTFYKERCLIINDKEEYLLTQRESDFLILLYEKKTLLGYGEIETFLGIDFNDNAIRQFIKKLRQKLPKGFLRNVQNSGYIINHTFLKT